MVLLYFVTVHSVLSNVAKIHSRLPAAMEFWLVCLGILAYSCQNTSRDSDVWTVIIFLMFYQEALLHLWTPHLFFFLPNDNLKHNEFSPPITRTLRKFDRIFAIRFRYVALHRITASQFIRRGLYPSWYKQVPTHCLLLFAIEAGDLLDSVKYIFLSWQI